MFLRIFPEPQKEKKDNMADKSKKRNGDKSEKMGENEQQELGPGPKPGYVNGGRMKRAHRVPKPGITR